MTTLVWEAYDPVAAAAAADDSHSEMDVVIDFDTPNLPQPPPPPPPRHPSLAIPIFTPSNDSQTFVWRYGTEQKQNDEDSIMTRTSSGYFQTAGQQQEFNGGSGIITTKFATRFSEYRPEDVSLPFTEVRVSFFNRCWPCFFLVQQQAAKEKVSCNDGQCAGRRWWCATSGQEAPVTSGSGSGTGCTSCHKRKTRGREPHRDDGNERFALFIQPYDD